MGQCASAGVSRCLPSMLHAVAACGHSQRVPWWSPAALTPPPLSRLVHAMTPFREKGSELPMEDGA